MGSRCHHQTFTHALYYLVANLSEYLEPLRLEVEEVVQESGWTKASLEKMHKLDSFIRESQRLHPIAARKRLFLVLDEAEMLCQYFYPAVL